MSLLKMINFTYSMLLKKKIIIDNMASLLKKIFFKIPLSTGYGYKVFH